MAHLFLKWILYPAMRLFFVRQINGLENIPKNKPYILAFNHASYIDGSLIILTWLWHTDEMVHHIMMKPMFRNWLRKLVFKTWLDQVSVNGSIQEAIDYLMHGKIIGISPEGGRTYTGKIQKPTGTGLGVMALETQKPVIPVGIKGAFELWPRFNRFPKLKRIIQISIGKPMKFKGRTTRPRARRITQQVLNRIKQLVK
jgi:1-acyl-sn-glycerol-3-phosphate acyltransferase